MDYVQFPNLFGDFKFKVSPDLVNFELFGMPISIKWYGVIIAIGFLLAMIYALKRAKDFDINPDRMIDVVLVSALFAFIGARLYYVLFSSDRDEFFSDPLSILMVWKGGLAIYGGIIFAFLTALWMCRVRKVNTLAMFDLASLGFLIGQGVGRWGNFFNQEAFGRNTSSDFLLGMTGNIIQSGQNGTGYDTTGLVHPTFLYESVWCLLGLLLLHIVSKKAYKFKGEIFSLYIIWYGAGRFFIEGLRTDSLMLGTMRVSQVLAALAVVGGIALFFILKNVAQRAPKNLFEESEELREEAEEAEEEALAVEMAEGEGAAVDEAVATMQVDGEASAEPAEGQAEEQAGETETDTAAEQPAPAGDELLQEQAAQEPAVTADNDAEKHKDE